MSDSSMDSRVSNLKFDNACEKTLFTLGYDVESERVDALYQKAVAEQWNMDQVVDWSQSIDPSTALLGADREAFLAMPLFKSLNESQRETFFAYYALERLSQLLHGEQGAMLVSTQLVHSLPDRDGKLFTASQAMDEARHVDVFSRYVGRMQSVSAPCPTIQRILAKILEAKSWQAQLVGMQVVVEGLAMASFVQMRRQASCPVLSGLLDNIMRDEARHVAFGAISLKKVVAGLDIEERVELEDFAHGLVQEYRNWGCKTEDWTGLFIALVAAGVDPTDYLADLRGMLESGEGMSLSPAMAQAMDGVIIPGLDRLGLISDRVRPRYEQDDIPLGGSGKMLDEIEQDFLRGRLSV